MYNNNCYIQVSLNENITIFLTFSNEAGSTTLKQITIVFDAGYEVNLKRL